MSKPSWEDLDAFIVPESEGGFAKPALFFLTDGTTRGSESSPIYVIYDDLFHSADLGEYDTSSSQPRLNGKETDFQGLDRGDEVEVDGERFDILGPPQRDGTGWAILQLARQDAAL